MAAIEFELIGRNSGMAGKLVKIAIGREMPFAIYGDTLQFRLS